MDTVFHFMGSFLLKICENGDGIGWSVAVFAVLIEVLMIFTTVTEIRSALSIRKLSGAMLYGIVARL